MTKTGITYNIIAGVLSLCTIGGTVAMCVPESQTAIADYTAENLSPKYQEALQLTEEQKSQIDDLNFSVTELNNMLSNKQTELNTANDMITELKKYVSSATYGGVDCYVGKNYTFTIKSVIAKSKLDNTERTINEGDKIYSYEDFYITINLQQASLFDFLISFGDAYISYSISGDDVLIFCEDVKRVCETSSDKLSLGINISVKTNNSELSHRTGTYINGENKIILNSAYDKGYYTFNSTTNKLYISDDYLIFTTSDSYTVSEYIYDSENDIIYIDGVAYVNQDSIESEISTTGLFETGTDTLIYSWDDMINTNKISYTKGHLEVIDKSLAGDLILPELEGLTSLYETFFNCTKLTSINFENVDTSNVHNMQRTFAECLSLTNLNLNNFDTSNVTDMLAMFGGCEKLTTLDLSSFNTSNVTYMQSMFLFCYGLNELDLSSFDTSNVAYMDNMFNNCNTLASLNLSSFDFTNVKSFMNAFIECSCLFNEDNAATIQVGSQEAKDFIVAAYPDLEDNILITL